MTIVTKFEIGDTVYHKLSGEEGLITGILILSSSYTEYRISTSVQTIGFVSEFEISKERVFV